MQRSGWLVLIVLGLVSLWVAACSVVLAPAQAEYGQPIRYMTGHAMEFPDMTMTYVGQHRVYPPQYARGFLYHDFRATQGDLEQIVSWSDGTGLLGPIDFTFGDQPYTLEITQWDTLGPVEFGTMIVQRTGS